MSHDQLLRAALRETARLLGKTETPPAPRRTDRENDGGLSLLHETGVPTVTTPGLKPDLVGEPTEAAWRASMAEKGIPMRAVTSTRSLREGSYTTTVNGKPVEVGITDDDTVGDATDLYAMLDHEYKGSPSVDATRLEAIIRGLHSGRPLSSEEWSVINDLKARFGDQLAAFRARGRDGQDARVPEGTGRVTPLDDPTTHESLRFLRESSIPTKEPADDRPAHEIAATLADTVATNHPDRAAVERLARHGAALSTADAEEIGQLAARHLDGSGVDLSDDDELADGDDLQEAAPPTVSYDGLPLRARRL